jgi:hypothetical protein
MMVSAEPIGASTTACDGHHKMSDFLALVNRFTSAARALRQCDSIQIGWSALA